MSTVTMGKLLRKSRNAKGYSQQQVADLLNLSRQSISSWENGRNYPDIENLVILSGIYEISLDEIKMENESLANQIEDNKKMMDLYEKQLDLIEELKHNLQNQNQNQNQNQVQEKDESILLGVFLLLGFFVPPFGVIAPYFIFKRNKKTNTFYHVIVIASICCLIFSVYSTCVIVNDLFLHRGWVNVEKTIE